MRAFIGILGVVGMVVGPAPAFAQSPPPPPGPTFSVSEIVGAVALENDRDARRLGLRRARLSHRRQRHLFEYSSWFCSS